MIDPRLGPVLAALATIDPVDERERRSIEQITREAPNLDRPFDEDAALTHVTASGLIVGTRGTVLHRHRKLGIWVQPGGHVDEGEDPTDAALREAAEETGLPLSHPPDGPMLIHADVHEGPRGHTHFDLRYLLLGGAVDPDPGPNESQEVLWLPFDQARVRCHAELAPAIGRAEELWEAHRARWRAKVEALTDETKRSTR